MAQNDSFDISKILVGIATAAAGWFGVKWAMDTDWGKKAIDWVKGLFGGKKEEPAKATPHEPAPAATEPPKKGEPTKDGVSAAPAATEPTPEEKAKQEAEAKKLRDEQLARMQRQLAEAAPAVTGAASAPPPAQPAASAPITASPPAAEPKAGATVAAKTAIQTESVKLNANFFAKAKERNPKEIHEALVYAAENGDNDTKRQANTLLTAWDKLLPKGYDQKTEMSAASANRFQENLRILEAIKNADGKEADSIQSKRLTNILKLEHNKPLLTKYELALSENPAALPKLAMPAIIDNSVNEIIDPASATPAASSASTPAPAVVPAPIPAPASAPAPATAASATIVELTDTNINVALKGQVKASHIIDYLDTSPSNADFPKMERVFSAWNLIGNDYKDPNAEIKENDKKLLLAAADNDPVAYASMLSVTGRGKAFSEIKGKAAHQNDFSQKVNEILDASTPTSGRVTPAQAPAAAAILLQ